LNSENETEEHIFSSDRPIQKESEDLLDRAHFSKELSKSLLSWKEDDSLVVGVYGKWGDGKTSVKNILKEEIQTNKDLITDILEFNPWQWSHSKTYLNTFLYELATLLDRKPSGVEVSKKLRKYSDYLSFTSEKIEDISKNLGKIIQGIGFVVGLVSIKLPEKYSTYTIFAAIVLVLLSQSLKFLNWVAKTYIEFRNIETKYRKNLEEQKTEIKDLLREQDKTILVVIDDIDRLSPAEIKDLFRLIKANADFPNIVYLTLFQRDVVEKALSMDGFYNGNEYLEKIIQVGINLPEVPQKGINSILFKKLDKVIEEYGGMKTFNQSRWNELFMEGIQSYFENLRDVNRFISSLSFQLGALNNNKVLEVNIVDIIGIEALRHFEPETYKALFKNKDILTGSSSSGYGGRENEGHKKRILKLIEDAGLSKDRVQSILKLLFPNTQWAWSNYHSNVDEDDFVDLRICHPERFDRYFSFFMTKNDFSEYEFQQMLDCTNDRDGMLNILKDYHTEGRLESFLERFEAYKTKVSSDHSKAFLGAMYTIGDLVSDEHKGFFQFSSMINLNRIVLWYLKKKEFESNRKAVFLEGLKNSLGIYLPIHDLWDEYERREFEKYPDHFSLTEEDKDLCKDMILEIINKHKSEKYFYENAHLERIIYIWSHLKPEESKEWLVSYLSSDDRFIKFIYNLISKSFSSSGYSNKTHHKLRINVLKLYFDDIESILKRLNKVTIETRLSDINKDILIKAVDWANKENDNPEKYNDRYDEDFDE